MTTSTCFAAAGRPSLDEIRRAFSEFARQHGVIEPKGGFVPDGKLHRCNVVLNGRVHSSDGAYRLFDDDVPAGWLQNWCNGNGVQTWCFFKTLTSEQKAKLAKKAEAAAQQFEADQAVRHKEATLKAEEQLAYAAPASDNHPYLVKKSVKPYGLSIDDDGWLLVPMRDVDGVVHSLQRISHAGEKLFLSGGRKRGLFFTIGAIDPDGEIYIGEGFATMANVHEAMKKPAVVAFDCGNLLPVAKALRAKYPSAKLIFCADDDAWTDGNPGRTKAEEAAKSVGGSVALPVFAEPRKMGATDFNDLAAAEGLQAVRRCIEKAAQSFKLKWPEPQPLFSRIEPEPYPLDALPGRIQAAVKEVYRFVKAPLSMVASSAIAALSTAAQALIDVRRDEELSGPVSLFLLIIAESGERKSQVDKMFTRPIQRYEDRKAEDANPLLKDDRAKMAAWESKHTGIKDRIRRAASDSKPTETYESELYEHERKRPEPRRIPKLMREDTTPEGLAKRLQHGWPSAGVISNEAGIVFGAHSMNNECATLPFSTSFGMAADIDQIAARMSAAVMRAAPA
jgi:putative DNA primase/helicase